MILSRSHSNGKSSFCHFGVLCRWHFEICMSLVLSRGVGCWCMGRRHAVWMHQVDGGRGVKQTLAGESARKKKPSHCRKNVASAHAIDKMLLLPVQYTRFCCCCCSRPRRSLCAPRVRSPHLQTRNKFIFYSISHSCFMHNITFLLLLCRWLPCLPVGFVCCWRPRWPCNLNASTVCVMCDVCALFIHRAVYLHKQLMVGSILAFAISAMALALPHASFMRAFTYITK